MFLRFIVTAGRDNNQPVLLPDKEKRATQSSLILVSQSRQRRGTVEYLCDYWQTCFFIL